MSARIAIACLLALAACDGCDGCTEDPVASAPEPPRPSPEHSPALAAKLDAAATKLKPSGANEHDVGAWRAYADALAGVKRIDEAIKAYDRCAFEGERTIQSAGEADVDDEVVDHAMYCSAAAVLGRQILRSNDGG